MKKKRKWLRRLGVAGLLLAVYPIFVLGYTWSCVFKSDLPGGRNGPLDAYRHALASAVVAHTLGDSAVKLVTSLFESGGRDSNTMDSHNNQIGAAIGTRAKSFAQLEPSVRQAVQNGAVGAADNNQITWLPETKWRNARMW